MNQVTVHEMPSHELDSWDDIVTKFDNWRVFHTKSWVEYIQSFSKSKALFLIFNKEGHTVGAMPGLLMKFPFFSAFVSPVEGWQTQSMGPVFDSEQTSSQEVIAAIIPFLQKEYRVKYIELASTHLDHNVMKNMSFRGESIFTQRGQLFPEDPDQTFKQIKSKTRNQIRKAQKLGLIIKSNNDDSFAKEFYTQLEKIFVRGGNAMPFSKNRVKLLMKHMRESGNLLTLSVYLPDDSTCCIATGIFLMGGRELYLWGWAHLREYGSKCPIELITWTAMQKGMEAGCTVFDMAGGGSSKKKYGSVPDETTYRWIWCKYRFILWCRAQAEKMYRRQQSLRGILVQKIRRGRQKSP